MKPQKKQGFGAKFFKADLHFHTPASEDARGSNKYNFNPYRMKYPKNDGSREYLEKAAQIQDNILADAQVVAKNIVKRFLEERLSLVAVTDHNSIGTLWTDKESANPIDIDTATDLGLTLKFYRSEKIEEIIRSEEKLNSFLIKYFGTPTQKNIRRFNTIFAIDKFLEKEQLLAVENDQGKYSLSLNVNWRSGKKKMKDFFTFPDNYILLNTAGTKLKEVTSGFSIDDTHPRPMLLDIMEGSLKSFQKRAVRYDL